MSDCGSCNSYLEEVLALQKQVAKLTEERDNLLKGTAARAERHYKELTTAQDRITELEQCIKSHGIPVKTYAGGVAHYCMGDGDALEAYRDGVIEECAKQIERSAPERVGEPNGHRHSEWADMMSIISRYYSMAASLRALKKGNV